MAQPGERSLQNAIWKRHCSCSTTITKTNKPRTHLGKNMSLVLNSKEAEKAMEKFSLLYCDTCLARVATKILHQILWALMQGRNCNCLEAITSVLLIIFFINVLISVLISVICYSGCIPPLIMVMSVFYFTKNAFLSYSPNSPLSTQISGHSCVYWSAFSDWTVLLFLLNLTFDFYINIDVLYKIGGIILGQMSSYSPFFFPEMHKCR